MYIYKIINLINNKLYVGQSSKAINESENYYGSGILIKKSIKKYGVENFKKEILTKCATQSELDNKEIYWIKKLNSMIPHGYNLTNGGSGVGFGPGHPNFGVPNTEKQKRKISETLTGIKRNPESVRMGAKARTGMKRTDEQKKRISDATKIAMQDKKIREKCSLGGKSVIWDDERRKMHSEVMQKVCSTEEWLSKNTGRLGIPHTDETKDKISKSNTGKIRSADTKKQISDSVKKSWEDEDYRKNAIEKGRQYRWVCNENEVIRCKVAELDDYIKLGYKRGRISQETICCPHCNKIGKGSVMHRWHFDNCKDIKWLND